MKTKIASFLSIVALSLLTLATGSFAEEEEGFYEKDHVRGFISVGADYRGMRREFQRYVNNTALADYGHLAAGCVVALIPVLIIFAFLQKRMAGGATAGAVKG